MEKYEYGKEFAQLPQTSEIIIDQGLFNQLPNLLVQLAGEKRIAIITDNNVRDLFGSTLLTNLNSQPGAESRMFSVAPGETSKNLESLGELLTQLSKEGYSRDTLLVSLGGGMAGDLTGVLASNYMRGVPYVHVPTTLLAQVDSSIGGKTGVDIGEIKNLFGRFELPAATYIDPELLMKLPEEEFKSGMGEVIKYAALDNQLLLYLEENLDKIISKDLGTITEVVSRCAKIKVETVRKDPEDRGIRRALNFGHTIGHAIEGESNFSHKHGEAISIGMVYEIAIAVSRGIFQPEDEERIVSLLQKVGLPIAVSRHADIEVIIGLMKSDKKNTNQNIRLAVPKRFGDLTNDGEEMINISEEELRNLLVT